MLLHTWFKASLKWGYTEHKEQCAACKRYPPINSRCLLLRLAHENYPDKFISKPIEVVCESCADLLWPKLQAGQTGYVRLDKAGEFGEIPFWNRWEHADGTR